MLISNAQALCILELENMKENGKEKPLISRVRYNNSYYYKYLFSWLANPYPSKCPIND